MKGRVVTIWDGLAYRHATQEEAERLVREDKAQICPVDGTRMKFRKQFTGYMTREMRAAPAPVEAPVVKAKAPVKKKEKEKTWHDYRKRAAKHYNQSIKATKMKQVLAYMEKHLGLEI